MKASVVLLCVFGLLAVDAVRPSLLRDRDAVEFGKFMKKFDRQYASTEETTSRFAIFKQNLRKIEQMSQANPDATFGVNKFADLTEAEFRSYSLGVKGAVRTPNMPVAAEVSQHQLRALPASWDWRPQGAVTEVKNQGQCGSCWSFSTTGNIEGQWFLANHSLPLLSEQEFVDCDHTCSEYHNQKTCDQGCNGGLMSNAFTFAIQEKGVDSETSYPYEGVDGTCRFKPASVQALISNWTMLSTDEDQMAAYLVAHGPVSIAADAEPWQFYTGGVFRAPCGTQLDHGILIVGYGTQKDILDKDVNFWIVKNSWGPDWGEKGYILLERGVGKCGCNLFACSSIV